MRTVTKVPNTTHRYLIDQLSGSQHLVQILYKRFLTFVHSILGSHKRCLASLASHMIRDHGSITKKNLGLISKESGLDDVINNSPSLVVSTVQYAPIPPGEEWRFGFLNELLQLRKHNLEIEWEDNVEFTPNEIDQLIHLVSIVGNEFVMGF